MEGLGEGYREKALGSHLEEVSEVMLATLRVQRAHRLLQCHGLLAEGGAERPVMRNANEGRVAKPGDLGDFSLRRRGCALLPRRLPSRVPSSMRLGHSGRCGGNHGRSGRCPRRPRRERRRRSAGGDGRHDSRRRGCCSLR